MSKDSFKMNRFHYRTRCVLIQATVSPARSSGKSGRSREGQLGSGCEYVNRGTKRAIQGDEKGHPGFRGAKKSVAPSVPATRKMKRPCAIGHPPSVRAALCYTGNTR